jgi:uncharacterized protein YuzE
MQRRIWIDYDEDADVLYMNFTYPPKAVEHERIQSLEITMRKGI